MSMSYKSADDCLNTKLRNTATPHLLLHTGNPGADGTANIAKVGTTTDISRKAITFSAISQEAKELLRPWLLGGVNIS